jgi:KDO2-lipid IV(A) lauroyltransferase
MNALFRMLAGVPLPLLHAVGGLLGWLVWWLAPDYRSASGRTPKPPDSRRAIPPGDRRGRCRWWETSLGVGTPQGESLLPKIVRWDGVAGFEAALDARKGVILISPHRRQLGDSRQAARRTPFGDLRPITALFRPPRKKFMADLIAGSGPAPACRPCRPPWRRRARADAHCAMAATPACLPDQVPPLGQGVWAPFFGRQAYTMTLCRAWRSRPGLACFSACASGLPRGAATRSGSSPSTAPR